MESVHRRWVYTTVVGSSLDVIQMDGLQNSVPPVSGVDKVSLWSLTYNMGRVSGPCQPFGWEI